MIATPFTEFDSLRSRNRARLLQIVLERGAISRPELGEAMGVSKVTATSIAAELLEEGWLTELGKTEGTTGRPAGLLELHERSGRVLGLDVQPHAIHGASGDLRGAETRRLTKRVRSRKRLNDALLETLEAALEAPPSDGPLRQIVIAVPAPVGPDGVPSQPTNLPELDAGRVLEWSARHGVPVTLENDIKLAAIAEFQRGAARGWSSFALLSERETGVGLGLFLQGRPYRGERGRAGELALVRWPHGRELAVLETLPLPAREVALAQLVGSLAVALDLNALVIHQRPDEARAFDLKRHVLEASVTPLEVKNSVFGDDGPTLGATLEAARIASERLILEVARTR